MGLKVRSDSNCRFPFIAMHWFNAHNLRRSFLLHSGMKLFVQTQCCFCIPGQAGTVLLCPGMKLFVFGSLGSAEPAMGERLAC